MSLNYVTITETFTDGSGNPALGSATFTPSAVIYASGVPQVTPATPIQAQIVSGVLRSNTGGALTLLATDNSGLTVEGQTGFWFWTVQVQIGSALSSFSFFLPHTPSTVELYALANTGAGGGGGGGGSGSVTSVSVLTANGFAGSVATPTTTPAITIDTTVTGLLKGNGTAVSAATSGTDYAPATSGTAILKGNGSGGFSNAAAGTDYLAPTGNGSGLTGLTESQVTNLTSDLAAKLPIAGGTMTGWLAPAVVALTFAATITVNAALGNVFAVTLTASTGTLGAPSNPVDGKAIRFRVIQDGAGGRTLSYNSGAGGYDFGASGAPTLSTSPSKVDVLAFEYVASLSKWCYLGSGLGF